MEEALRVWERKILRMVYDSKRDTNGWRIRTNKELQDQYRNADIVTSILVLMEERKIFSLPSSTWPVGQTELNLLIAIKVNVPFLLLLTSMG
jgi:hypothetical protein